jgi:nitrogen fixation protein FixH
MATTVDLPAPTPKPRSFLASWGWPIGIATVLIVSAGSNIWVAAIARSDPAFAVEPDYYQKAVAWDSTMAQERANAALGWHAGATLEPVGERGNSRLTLTLMDRDGRPIGDAAVTVEAMHNARSAQRFQLALTPGDRGYTGALAASRAGEWELRVTAVRGAERFTEVLRVTLASPGER